MPITFVGAGAVATAITTSPVTAGFPASLLADDILLLVIESANQLPGLPVGWTDVAGSPQLTGTAGGVAATRLDVLWKRHAVGDVAPTVNDGGGDHVIFRIFAFRGAIKTGSPINASAGAVLAAAATAFSIPGLTTTVAECMVVDVVTNATDTATGQGATATNASLASVTSPVVTQSAVGNGGGYGFFYGIDTVAGAVNATTGALATASVQARLKLALAPHIDVVATPITSAPISTPAPQVTQSTLSQKHSLATASIATGATVVSLPTLGQTHSLITDGPNVVINGDGKSFVGWNNNGGASIDNERFRIDGTGAATGFFQFAIFLTLGQKYKFKATLDQGNSLGRVRGGLQNATSYFFDYNINGPNISYDFVASGTTGELGITFDGAGTGVFLPTGEFVFVDNVLVAKNGSIATGAAQVTQATLSSSAPADVLTAANINTPAPAIQVASVGQSHVLAALALATVAPALAAATLGQTHALTAAPISAPAPAVALATVGQKHALTSAPIATPTPAIVVATVGQKHALNSALIATPAPSIAVATIGQTHALNNVGIATPAPVITTVTIGQTHSLSTDGPELVPNGTFDNNTDGWVGDGDTVVTWQNGKLRVNADTAPPHTTTRNITGLVANKSYKLSTSITPSQNGRGRIQYAADNLNLILGAEALGDNVTSEVSAIFLSPNNFIILYVGAASGGAWADAGQFADFDYISVKQVGRVETGAAQVTQAILTTPTNLTAQNINTLAASVSIVNVGQKHALTTVTTATQSPAIAVATVAQTHSLNAANIATPAPAINISSLSQTHSFASQPIATAVPQISQATLVADNTAVLTSIDIATLASSITQVTLGQMHALASVFTLGSEQVVNGTYDTNVNDWNADEVGRNVTWDNGRIKVSRVATTSLSSAVQFTSTLIGGRRYRISGNMFASFEDYANVSIRVYPGSLDRSGTTNYRYINISEQGANFSVDFTPATGGFNQLFLAPMRFTAPNIFTYAPTIGDFATFDNISIKEVIREVATSPAAINQATLSQTHALNSLNVDTPAPVIQPANMTATTALVSLEINAPAPDVTQATVGQSHALTTAPLATSTPAIAQTSLGQRHSLASAPIATASPAIAPAALGQSHALASAPISTPAPIVGNATLGQLHALLSLNVNFGAPQISIATLAEIPVARLTALDIATPAPVISQSILTSSLVLIPTPIERTFSAGFENRVWVAGYENRNLVVSYENRTLNIARENRVLKG